MKIINKNICMLIVLNMYMRCIQSNGKSVIYDTKIRGKMMERADVPSVL